MSLSKSQKWFFVFNDDLEKELLKTDWSTADRSRVVCAVCGVHFSVTHRGRSDIAQHTRSNKHKVTEKTVSSSYNLQNFLVVS